MKQLWDLYAAVASLVRLTTAMILIPYGVWVFFKGGAKNERRAIFCLVLSLVLLFK